MLSVIATFVGSGLHGGLPACVVHLLRQLG
jgi:hypothetical protein